MADELPGIEEKHGICNDGYVGGKMSEERNPTAKNAMVKDFYGLQGFTKIKEEESGNTIWQFDIKENYEKKNNVITVNE